MTDRELLEQAARAAGYEFVAYHVPAQDRSSFLSTTWSGPWAEVKKPEAPLGNCRWRPLTDDGDGLRLAVLVGAVIDPSNPASIVVSIPRAGIIVEELLYGPDAGDACAATRRAIVRAAAEIGKESS